LTADCLLQVGLNEAIEALRSFPDLQKVWFSDDYLKDSQKDEIAAQMRSIYPKLDWTWSYDLKVDGRHGR
jgi:hypothetical protein